MDWKECRMILFEGFKVYASDDIADLVQAKKHRKKRINKKWLKRYGVKKVPWKSVIINKIDRSIYCHPDTLELIRQAISKGGHEENEKRAL